MNATATPAAEVLDTLAASQPRYSVVRLDGRWKVYDLVEATYATAASRAKAEERAAKLNAEEPWGLPPVPPMIVDETDPRVTTDPAELAVLRAAAARLDALPTEEDETCPACGESLAAEPHDETCPMAIHPVPTARGGEVTTFSDPQAEEAPLAVVTIDGEETTVQVTETPAETAPAGHRISWFVYLEDGVRTRYSSSMTGDLPAWDLTCSCGWDSATGGATKGAVRKAMAAHKAEHSA